MTVVRHMNLVYSLFVYLSYVTPACGNIIFHESIGLAPANEQNAIYAARESIARTAATSEDEDWDDDDFLLNVAVDLVETQEKQQLLLEKVHQLGTVDYSYTLDKTAIGIAPMMWVYMPYLRWVPLASDPDWLYDPWAGTFFPNNANFQRCARLAAPGEARFMATTFRIGGGYSYSYIVLCRDAQYWINLMPGSTPPTLYDALTLDHEILEGEDWSVDTFGTLLDFALLTQILHVPVVLQSPNYDGPLPDLPAANQVTGWAACKDVMDPGNAATAAFYATAVVLRSKGWAVVEEGNLEYYG